MRAKGAERALKIVLLRNSRTTTASFIGHQVNVDYIMRLCHLWRYSSRVDKKRHYTRARVCVLINWRRESTRAHSPVIVKRA